MTPIDVVVDDTQSASVSQPSKAHVATTRRGRPAKRTEQVRNRKVTIALTEREYQRFQHLAGHLPPTSTSPSARPRREHGSIAGHIRLLIQQKSPRSGGEVLATVEREQTLGKLANECNALIALARKAEEMGYLVVSVQLQHLQERISQILDEFDNY